jgi:hypothetical protein
MFLIDISLYLMEMECFISPLSRKILISMLVNFSILFLIDSKFIYLKMDHKI